MTTKLFKVPQTLNGQRIDVALLELCKGELSRRKIRQIIDVGGVYHNRSRVRIASRTVRTNDQLKMEYSLHNLTKLKHTTFELAKEDIVFEDEYYIAIDKPPGLPAQATKDQSIQHAGTALLSFLKKRGDQKAYVENCHRLDKETSGVMLFAKTKEAAKEAAELFKNHLMTKKYLCLVWGKPKEREFQVKVFLSPINPKNGVVSVVRSGGKSSLTLFKLLSHYEKQNISLLAAFPKSGRTHQIRVHLQSISCPIVGDKIYSSISTQKSNISEQQFESISSHQMLHAEELSFQHPFTKATLTILATPPPTFTRLLDSL